MTSLSDFLVTRMDATQPTANNITMENSLQNEAGLGDEFRRIKVEHSAELARFLKQAKARDHRAIFDIVVCGWGRIAAAITPYILWPNAFTYLVAIFFVSSGMGILVALSHESQHSALLRSKKWNDLVGAWLCAYPVGSVYGASRAVHLAHHKHLNTDLDPDRHFHLESDKSTPKQFASYFLRLLLGGQVWTSFVVNGFLRKFDSEVTAKTIGGAATPSTRARKTPEIANLIPVQAILFAILWAVTGHWWAYFALWLVPIFTFGTFFGYLRGFIDHARLEADDADKSAGRLISVPNPSFFDRFLLTGLDFHFHAEHHFFPSVPHYYLPELHKVLQNDPAYCGRYLVRPTYFSFLRDYWKQISLKSK